MSQFLKGIKNVSYLSIGNIIATIIHFGTFILVARYLSLEDYGIWTSIGAFVSLFVFFNFEGLSKVVVREGSRNVDNMVDIFNSTIALKSVFLLFSTFLCLIVLYFMPYEGEIKLFIAFGSYLLFTNGMIGFISTIYHVTEKFEYITIFNILNKILFFVGTYLALEQGYGIWGPLYAGLIANLFILILTNYYASKLVSYNLFSKIIIDYKILKASFIFSIVNFVSFLTTRIDLFMISILGNMEEVGIYGIAYKIATQLVLFRNFAAMAFFPIFVKRFEKGSVRALSLLKYSLLLLLLLVSFVSFLNLFIEDILILTFGIKYQDSVYILKVLLYFNVFIWAMLPFSITLQATNNEKGLLYLNSITAVANIIFNFYFYQIFGLIGIAYSTLAVYSLSFIMITIFTNQKLKKDGFLA